MGNNALITAIYAVFRRVWKGSAIQIKPTIFKAWAISTDFGRLIAIALSFSTKAFVNLELN
jgi:hypothetical protein